MQVIRFFRGASGPAVADECRDASVRTDVSLTSGQWRQQSGSALREVLFYVIDKGKVMRALRFSPVLVLACIAACERSPTPAEKNPSSRSRNLVAPDTAWTVDDEFARIARDEVPGFGGFFRDSAGDAVIYLKDLRRASAAAALAAVRFGGAAGRPLRSLATHSTHVSLARYDYVELKAWRDALRGRLPAIPGVATLDIDETRNRIAIGIGRPALRGAVTRVLDAVGVPRAAVVMHSTSVDYCQMDDPNCSPSPADGGSGPAITPIDGATPDLVATGDPGGGTLRGRVRPLVAGIEIYHDPDAAGNALGCTLGAVVYGDFSNGRFDGIITASHCSRTQWHEDATPFMQYGDSIATELYDPASFNTFMNGDCYSGFQCRYSDVSFAPFRLNANYIRGYIARPAFNTWADSGTISVSGRFTVRWQYGIPMRLIMLGDTMMKVGRKTGWTSGRVIGTCEDIYFYRGGDGYGVLCQTEVAGGASTSDSGAPVSSGRTRVPTRCTSWGFYGARTRRERGHTTSATG
jgi:hypothetical protein